SGLHSGIIASTLLRFVDLDRDRARHRLLRVARDVTFEHAHRYRRIELVEVSARRHVEIHLLVVPFEGAVITGLDLPAAHVGTVIEEEAREAERQLVVEAMAAVALTALNRAIVDRAVRPDTVVGPRRL